MHFMMEIFFFVDALDNGYLFLCRHVSGHIDDTAFASLTVWNMKTWKAMVCVFLVPETSYDWSCQFIHCPLWLDNFLAFLKTVLPLGEDPPAITSLCFNHNGKILAASATDGMIHMFGILLVSTTVMALALEAKIHYLRGGEKGGSEFSWAYVDLVMCRSLGTFDRKTYCFGITMHLFLLHFEVLLSSVSPICGLPD